MHVNVESVTNPDPQIQKRLILAIDLAYHAGQKTLEWFSNPLLEVRHKSDRSPVTVADEMAESFVRQALLSAFPSDGFLGEESGSVEGTSGFDWIVDPIDGTKSFIHGVPLFGTLIGVEFASTCVIGVVRFPALNEVIYAAQGHGAWWKTKDAPLRRVHVSSVESLSQATFCNTNPTRWLAINKREALHTLLSTVQLARGWGDCYGHMLVATGRAELMIDPAMNPWDAAALKPIVEEAGGCFIDWTGIPTIHGGNGLSVIPSLKDEVLKILQL